MPTPTKGPRLGGSPAHEKAIIANLARALFEHGRITTTLTKAKRLRPRAEHLITFAKKGDLASRRQVLRVVRDKDVVYKLFDEIAPRFAGRQGGYTRILKLGPRQGDNAPMALIELVEQAPAAPEATTEAEPERRRRFGRRRDAQEAPAGANRAQRRAAARGKLAPVTEHDHEHDEEEAGDEAIAEAVQEAEELPAVPTDEELAAGAAPVVEAGEEDTDSEDEDEDEADATRAAAETAEGEAEAETGEADTADDDDGPADGKKKA